MALLGELRNSAYSSPLRSNPSAAGIPFFYNWGIFYEQGAIDGSEWTQNWLRFYNP